jgi:hypothetical protein
MTSDWAFHSIKESCPGGELQSQSLRANVMGGACEQGDQSPPQNHSDCKSYPHRGYNELTAQQSVL